MREKNQEKTENYDWHCVRLADPFRKLDDPCGLWAITVDVEDDQSQYLYPLYLAYLEMEEVVASLREQHLGDAEAAARAMSVLRQIERGFGGFWSNHGEACMCEWVEHPCCECGWSAEEITFIQAALAVKLHRLEEVVGVDPKTAGDLFMASAMLAQVLFAVMRRWFDNGPYLCS